MRPIDAERLLEVFDEHEPCEDYEFEHELWLDLRLEVINAPTIDTDPTLYGDYLSLAPGDSVEKAKALLVEEIKRTVDELAKQDEFWIVKENCDQTGKRTIGWKIAVPNH